MTDKKDNPEKADKSQPGEHPLISSYQLFGKNKTVEIEHQGETYILQITRQGKLILTK